jgi:mono/diheme cytochrome c family protein
MFERMLIGKIENRILVGIIAFVGTMVLIGWASINEGGRMQAFDQMFHARSVENGAALFSNNCSTCHGVDGRGLAGKAPGLNNPQFFGHDFYPEITKQVGDLQAEKTALTKENTLDTTSADRKEAIKARIKVIDEQVKQISDELYAKSELKSAIAAGYKPDKPARLRNLGWSGTQPSFILTTLIHGRPVSSNYWPQPMPAWSQTAGGPLRTDQLQDLTNYILNWDKGKDWTIDDLLLVKQFAIEPKDPRPFEIQIQQLEASGGKAFEPIGSDVDAILAQVKTLKGDAAKGDKLYHGLVPSGNGTTLACSGCHMAQGAGTGPQLGGTFTRITDERLKLAQFAGYTPEKYIIESIVQPSNYLVPGFQDLMIKNLGENLSPQDIADLIAFLETQK